MDRKHGSNIVKWFLLLKIKFHYAKVIRVIVLSAVIVIVVLFISLYMIIHNYINKLNFAETPKEVPFVQSIEIEQGDEIRNDIELEEGLSDAVDSPEKDILSLEEKIRLNMEENSTPIIYDEDVFNVLLIGSDTRETGDTGRSDAMIIISINKKTKTIIATSLLRDIYLQIPERTNNRINTAYAYGGAELLLETIKLNFKIEIDRYASINFNSFIDIVDAVGGVTLEITEEEIPVINKYVRELNQINGEPEEKDILTEPGTYLLNGTQALGYARNRYVGMDFERTARQRRVLEQIFNNMKNLNLLEINNLMNIVLPKITTNLTEGELFSMILTLPTYTEYSLEEWSIPVKGSYSFMKIRGMSVIGIDFEENIKELRYRVYGVQ
jgi:LCP family protein required for cell wall assembly